MPRGFADVAKFQTSDIFEVVPLSKITLLGIFVVASTVALWESTEYNKSSSKCISRATDCKYMLLLSISKWRK